MADDSEETGRELDPFEVDIIERMIAGEIRTEVLVGDGEFADLAFGSLRERVRPQSILAEIDADVAKRLGKDNAH